jgi:hypothetical protein
LVGDGKRQGEIRPVRVVSEAEEAGMMEGYIEASSAAASVYVSTTVVGALLWRASGSTAAGV